MHVFYVVAMAAVADEPHAAGDKRQTILHFWSAAKSQLGLNTIKKVLYTSKERKLNFGFKSLDIALPN